MTSANGDTYAQLQCVQKGGPFEVIQVSKPIPGPDQVLIRNRVAALNLLDCKQRDYGALVASWPHVLGIEGAGVVEAVGSRVKDFQLGDEVFSSMSGRAHAENWGGSYQEYVLAPTFFVAKKPKNISLEEAASLPICYNTALCGVHGVLKIPLPYLPGTSIDGTVPESILILGGSSAVGAAAIQLLRLAHPDLPIFATSSSRHHAHLASLGATKLFDYKSSSTLVSEVKNASLNGKGIDVILDCVSAGVSQKDICDVFDPTGSKVYSYVITGIDVPVAEGIKKLEVSGLAMAEMQGGGQAIKALTKLVEERKYKIPVPVKVIGHGLEEIPAVMDQLKTVSGAKLLAIL